MEKERLYQGIVQFYHFLQKDECCCSMEQKDMGDVHAMTPNQFTMIGRAALFAQNIISEYNDIDYLVQEKTIYLLEKNLEKKNVEYTVLSGDVKKNNEHVPQIIRFSLLSYYYDIISEDCVCLAGNRWERIEMELDKETLAYIRPYELIIQDWKVMLKELKEKYDPKKEDGTRQKIFKYSKRLRELDY